MRLQPVPKKPGKSINDSFPPSRGAGAAAKKGGNMKVSAITNGGSLQNYWTSFLESLVVTDFLVDPSCIALPKLTCFEGFPSDKAAN